jgi:hypothetical protein
VRKSLNDSSGSNEKDRGAGEEAIKGAAMVRVDPSPVVEVVEIDVGINSTWEDAMRIYDVVSNLYFTGTCLILSV